MHEMQMFKPLDHEDTALVGWGVTALFASADGGGEDTERRLAGLGVVVVIQGGLYDMLAEVLDDPRGADLLVMDCDTIGGLDAGRRAFCILADAKVRMPVILISSDCVEQTFPVAREAPFMLRAPLSVIALRLALEAAFPSVLNAAAPLIVQAGH
jgi:hypothetical protein